MPPEPPPLGEADVIDHGGWHPRYVRVLAVANEGDVGFALVDGNGDGADLYTETWYWHNNTEWVFGHGGGDGHIDDLGPCKTSHIGDAHLAYGSAPGRDTVTIAFDGQSHIVPVSRFGVWAFLRTPTNPLQDFPSLSP